MSKGERNDVCARTVCGNTPARWFNRSTYRYYCDDCAARLNEVNAADALRLLGGPLCVLPDSPAPAGGAR